MKEDTLANLTTQLHQKHLEIDQLNHIVKNLHRQLQSKASKHVVHTIKALVDDLTKQRHEASGRLPQMVTDNLVCGLWLEGQHIPLPRDSCDKDWEDEVNEWLRLNHPGARAGLEETWPSVAELRARILEARWLKLLSLVHTKDPLMCSPSA